MNSVAASELWTVLLVSHNMQAVSALASRCFLIESGRGVALGPTEEVIRAYLDAGSSKTASVFEQSVPVSRPGIGRVALKTSLPDNTQSNGSEMSVEFRIVAPRPVQSGRLSFQIRDTYRRPVAYVQYFGEDGNAFDLQAGTHDVVCRLPVLRLYKGRYSLAVSFSEKHGLTKLDRIEDVCPFEVVMFGKDHEGGWGPDVCVYTEDYEWHVESPLAGSAQ
jgi:lipopolysaccharide transport system ATP-binding protein